LTGAFRRFYASGASADRAYGAGTGSRAALRSAMRRYAVGELAWLWSTGRRRWIPYTVIYELAKATGLQLGLRRDALARVRARAGRKRRHSGDTDLA
jgi:hypothetical protein